MLNRNNKVYSTAHLYVGISNALNFLQDEAFLMILYAFALGRRAMI